MFALATVSPPEPERRIKRLPLGAGSAVSHFHSSSQEKERASETDGEEGDAKERGLKESAGKPDGGLKTPYTSYMPLCYISG